VDASYIISETLDVEMTTLADMTFKCHSWSSNVLGLPTESSYNELLLVVYMVTFAVYHSCFRDTSCFNAENHIFASPTCINLEFKGFKFKVNASGGGKNVVLLKVIPLQCGDKIWRHKTKVMRLSYGEEIMVVG